MKVVRYSMAVVAIVTVVYFYRLFRLTQQLQVFNTIEINTINFDGVELKINSLIKNPSNVRLTITRPFVSIYLPGEQRPIASSNLVRSGDITFEPDSQNVVSILLPVSFAELPGSLQRLKEIGKVEIEITARFGLNKMFRFTKREVVEI